MRIKLLLLFLWFSGICLGQSTDSIINSSTQQIQTLADTIQKSHPIPVNEVQLNALMNNRSFIRDGMVQVPYEPKSDEFLDRYMEVVFRRSKTLDSLNKTRMRLWKESLRVFMDPSVPKEDRDSFEEFAQRLDKEVDSLSIEFVEHPKSSNYRIYYTNQEFTNEYEANLIGSIQSYYIYWDGYKINKGFLKINSERISEPMVRQKLMQWRFFQSLGHFTLQDDLPCEDYLSSCFNVEKELSAQDLEVLKYHYSYGICKGTRVLEFRAQHERARESLEENPNNKYYFVHSLN